MNKTMRELEDNLAAAKEAHLKASQEWARAYKRWKELYLAQDTRTLTTAEIEELRAFFYTSKRDSNLK